ncbi:succinate--CoA ligase subunit beta [Candidatus Bipolaricaulota bacterium]|nr:succinate--CoA ligase subunit beta [Candidatus Bipolaricaulota bacterium]MBS3792101.1 succinate--CoA ligase subunit beta [Candidatus Bipolaricaulota bacterium]
MRLLEYQGKKLFEDYNIPVPKSQLVRNLKEDEVELLPESESLIPGVLKAQVPVGGRGKAGGVKKVSTYQQAKKLVRDLLSSEIKGFPVGAVLIEEELEIERELYFGLLLNKSETCITAIASSAGGVDIERVAEEEPEKITQLNVDPSLGLQDYMIRYLAKRIGLKSQLSVFREIARSMYEMFIERDATLVEINPLAETTEGLIALDSKILLDDAASYRHGEEYSKLKNERFLPEEERKTRAERLAEELGITYVQLEGNVGLISDGAGTGMLTLDEITDAGGKPANFCEMGGEANAEVTEKSLEVVLANSEVESLLITLIGGLTRMDEIAEGIVEYVRENGEPIPFVVRMCGTKEKEGKSMLADIGIDTFDNHREAVETAVRMAEEE